MIAFDTDVMTEVLLGTVAFVERAAAVPASEQAVPVNIECLSYLTYNSQR